MKNRVLRSVTAALLCCLLTVTCCSPAALADISPINGPPVTEEPVQPPETETPSPDETEPPAANTCKVKFSMGSFGTKTVTVERGMYPDTPSIPELPAASVLGWYDEAGTLVSPGSLPVYRDTVYTARWARQVSGFLNTSEHFAYIKGYANGMFKPQAGITRAEAAQLFYNLLSTQSWEEKRFSDVPETQWYAKPVGVMATLGILQGYSDGSFKPNKKITRAEFVKMAVSCDTILDGKSSFKDVSASSWAAPYIATAASKGWISGFKDGTFRPDATITREEAVTILNKMLGRTPDASVKTLTEVKNFYDVFPGSWSYGDIVEASTAHSYSLDGSSESWTQYEHDTEAVVKSGWVKDGQNRYYLDAKTGKFLRGQHTIDGQTYVLDSSTGVAYTGFRNEGSWRWYYKNGVRQTDISNLGVVSGPYYIEVYKPSNYLIVYAKDNATGHYTIPVKAMLTSCGEATPCGTFYTPSNYRWLTMAGNTFAQWCTQIEGNYLFHSVPNWTHSEFDLEVDEYNHLGETRSMGCVRLCCRDAKWIYDNCALGTKVFISAVKTEGPLPKPTGIKIPAWHTWDPTDPTAYWKCKQTGCH